MARPKKFRERTREYLANLVYDEGITEREYVQLVIQGTKSPDSTERTKCMEMLQNWLGFKDADKRVSEAISELPVGNISKEDLKRLATPMEDRCGTCRHQYHAKDTASSHKETAPVGEVEGEADETKSVEISGVPEAGNEQAIEKAADNNPSSEADTE